jgi:hypothetical protein
MTDTKRLMRASVSTEMAKGAPSEAGVRAMITDGRGRVKTEGDAALRALTAVLGPGI